MHLKDHKQKMYPQMHQPDEYIEIAALAEGLGFLDRLLTHMKPENLVAG